MFASAAEYGDGCAQFYDEIYAPAPRAAVAQLVALASAGPVLEAGVGTGRYALPLAAHGIEVHGIDASSAMLDVLRRKAGATSIVTTLADFSVVSLDRAFRLIVCLTNTIALLPDSARQAQAIARFAAALDDDGTLLIETTHAADGAARTSTDVTLPTRHGARRYRADCCEVDSEALDAWAAEGGLRCIARWRDWRGTPWRGEPGNLLSLYRRKTTSAE